MLPFLSAHANTAQTGAHVLGERYLVALLQCVDHGGESPLRVGVLARQQRVLAVEAAQLAYALLVRRSQLLLHLSYVTTTTSRR